MYTYHSIWGEWLRLRYAPFALGFLLFGTRARDWEVSHERTGV